MNKILQLSTYGIKNIENKITLEFANSTIKSGLKKVNNVKGIYGYNGSGKTAVINSVYLYKNIVLGNDYLRQDKTKEELEKLINLKTKEFFFSAIFNYNNRETIRHSIRVEKEKITNDFIITEEEIAVSQGRTLNESFVTTASKKNGTVNLYHRNKTSTEDSPAMNSGYSSIIIDVLKYIAVQKEKSELSPDEQTILNLYECINSVDVFLMDSDKHQIRYLDKKMIDGLLSRVKKMAEKYDNPVEIYSSEIIPKEKIKDFENDNSKLENFIQIFKPELKQIKLIKKADKNIYHIRRVFVYEKYEIEEEYESSGIKQLVKLFAYLLRCARGNIVFIDEIDANINTAYFEKLIAFFKEYGKGQLVFTSHNVEAMNVLKGLSRSISALGDNGKIDTWVAKGNKSPKNEYLNGSFPNSPMNVESFDFINVFLGESDD